jgi:NADPH:quinone reductase-like Zn-dependent oxidoreductase
MKAIVQNGYGQAGVFALIEMERPVAKDNQVLVRVHAASLHAGDVFGMRGVPYVVRMSVGWPNPKHYIPGYDVAGRIEAVGADVTRFQPGDAVFGACSHTCAEYVCAAEDKLTVKPANLTFAQAAAVPTSGVAALHGLRNAGKVEPGQKVLINGAAGGVGTFAVQIAKALGAEVTGVCSTRNVELVRAIGADHVVDYTQEDFTRSEQRYDLILDNVANHPLADCRRVLSPSGTLIPNSGNRGLGYVIEAFVLSMFVRGQGRPFFSLPQHEDLVVLQEWIESGKVTPVIDRTYPLCDTPEAFRYLDEGHARGKVVISVADDGSETMQDKSGAGNPVPGTN